MISDNERREIAQKLRTELWHMKLKKEWYEEERDLDKCGNRAYRNIAGSVAESDNCINIVERLADLIDRQTCSIKRGYQTTWDVCSRCGALVNAERAVSTAIEYLPTRYCPNCGAEVIGYGD